MAAEVEKPVLVTVPQDFADKITAIIGEGWKLEKHQIKGAPGWRSDGTYYLYDKDLTQKASFSMQGFPACCGVAISFRGHVYNPHRKGLGTVLNALRIKLAKDAGFGVLICTDRDQNEPERKILAKNGWKDVHTFVNPRSTNKVHISVKDL